MLRLGLIQCAFTDDAKESNEKIIHFIKEAHKKNAQVILTPELCLGHYFCKTQDEANFARAYELSYHPFLKQIQKLAKDLAVVVPYSFFEKSGPHFYNSLAMINADGEILGVYRKSHIPDGPGYQEKFYFRPGNTGFKVFTTKYGVLGAGICWDQWFFECARIMTLQGADLLLYPTAIGSEPHAPDLYTKKPWVLVMKGQAVSNMIPLACANRIGIENDQTFYGASFICNELGEDLLECNDSEGAFVAPIDLAKAKRHRDAFGFFRDRRVDLYGDLLR
jgi:N-carbamoylputrescine amidase